MFEEQRALAVPEPEPEVIIVTPDMVMDPPSRRKQVWIYEAHNNGRVHYEVLGEDLGDWVEEVE